MRRPPDPCLGEVARVRSHRAETPSATPRTAWWVNPPGLRFAAVCPSPPHTPLRIFPVGPPVTRMSH